MTAELVRRRLRRDEIGLLWTIDRREIVERIYVLRRGELVLEPGFFDILGWPPGEPEDAMEWLVDSFDRDGVFLEHRRFGDRRRHRGGRLPPGHEPARIGLTQPRRVPAGHPLADNRPQPSRVCVGLARTTGAGQTKAPSAGR